MDCAPGDSFGWRQRRWQHPQQEKDEEEEEDKTGGRADKNLALDVGGKGLMESMDRWHLSSSSEILEEAELQDCLALSDEEEQNLDLDEVQDLDCVGDSEPQSPPSEKRKGPAEEGDPEDFTPISYWEGQLVVMDEDQYGSDFSASPEALRDPLALYRSDQSFTSDGGEDFREHSHHSLPPPRPPPDRGRLKIEVFETQHPQESPQEMEFSSPLSSSVGSTPWNQGFLDPLSMEDLQNGPGMDAENFPESSCIENAGECLGTVVKVANMVRPSPFMAAKLNEEGPGTIAGKEGAARPQPERARKLKANVPHGLPSRFTRQSRSLSPRERTPQKMMGCSSSGEAGRENCLTTVASDAPQYGRGQLNYPLPDLSKVEPRVRFPKDPRRYRPPQGKNRPAGSTESGKPVVFKSPAEIVREVLLSSGEGSPRKVSTPTISVIPKELKSPRQATELVQQLQEDYRKLLTKYAEAENTIDRLRLGTKVRLYADPPQSTHGVQMGTMPRGSKVMTFHIPLAQVADVSARPEAAWQEGSQAQEAAFSPLLHSTVSGVPGAAGQESVDRAVLEAGPTQALSNRARALQRQVEWLEKLIWAGKVTSQDRLKGFAQLREAQGALEQAYLHAREEYWRMQASTGAPADFDPDRAVEGEIFRLGMRLQVLKESIDQASLTQPATGSDSEMTASPSSFPLQASKPHMRSPTPSLQAPIPAVRTPYPEAPIPKDRGSQAQVEVSSVSDETEGDEEGLPEPLRHKQLQVEKDLDHLLDCYSSFRSLPEALSWEQLDLEGRGLSLEEVDCPAMEDAGAQIDSHGVVAEVTGTPCNASLETSQEREPPILLPRKFPQPPCQAGHLPTGQASKGSLENSRPPAMAPQAASPRKPEHLSPRSSLASVAESAVSEHTAQKSFRRTGSALLEEVRIVSPETDSGFIGSEASRVSPLAQPPKRRSSRARLSSSGGALEESAWPSRRRKAGLAMPPFAPRSRGTGAGLAPPGSPAAAPTLQPAAHRRKDPDAVESLWTGVTPEGVPRRPDLAKEGSFHLGTPPRWADSIASELEPETDSTRSDSEDRGGPEAGKPPPSERRFSPCSSSSPSPARTRRYSLLDSRMERDQAITALQNEVSQLRRSLEETLHQPQGSPKRHSSRAWAPPQGGARFSRSHDPEGKTSRGNVAKSKDTALAVKLEECTRRARSSQDSGTQLDLAPSEAVSSVATHREISASKTKPSKQLILQEPYTGTQSSFLTPDSQEPTAHKGSQSCPPCQEELLGPGEEPMPEQGAKEAAGPLLAPRKSRAPSQHGTQKKMAPCLLCKGSPRRKAMPDHGKEDTSAQGKPGDQRQPQQPGLWYLVVPPPTLSVDCATPVPLVPRQPVMFCSAPAPTSASAPASLPVSVTSGHPAPERRTRHSLRQPPEHHLRRSLTLYCDGWYDLNRSLSRALEAAEGLKGTTKRMSRSLTSELSRARGFRGSCLF